MPLLTATGIKKLFGGVVALSNGNLTCEKGRITGLLGTNGSGKSTISKIITGVYGKDSGTIVYEGREIAYKNPNDAKMDGISMVFQNLSLIPDLTVWQNIVLGIEKKKGLFLNDRQAMELARGIIEDLKPGMDVTRRVGELNPGEQQITEIAKAISMNAKVIIMDEPSSAIADAEIEVLFGQIFRLREQGVAILYITHKMDEIFRIADEITIIRDGKWIESGPAGEYDSNKLVSLMVGREITSIFPKDTTIPIGDVVLEVKHLTQQEADGGRFRDISFRLHRGEILGFSGLVGAGRSELMRAIFGLDAYTSGEIYIDGKPVHIRNTADAIAHGIAMVSEDRKEYGLVLGRNIAQNISLANMKQFTKWGLVNDQRIAERSKEMVELLRIKIAGLDVAAYTLSGGNQQKVVLAKWLIGNTKIMILDEPTRGIDVGAKSEIHKLMGQFARQGMAVIMISSELPEVVGMSDRVVVMQEGVQKGILDREQATQENIMRLATGGMNLEQQ